MKMFRKIKERKGFTLVEMMVVVAILAITLAFAVPNLISYQKRIKLTELDDSARTIFMAAQNRLMSLKSAGTTDLGFSGAKEVEWDNIPGVYKEKMSDEDLAEIRDIIDNAPDKYNIDFRYITSNDIRESTGPSILNLSGGSIEGNIAENNFIIEYDANTGYVFGVFYWEDEGTLDLSNDVELNKLDRGFDVRMDNAQKGAGYIGYYGGGTVVNTPEPNPQTKPETPDGSSKEKLSFKIKNPEPDKRCYFWLTITGYDYRACKYPGNRDNYKHTIAIISKEDRCYLDPGASCTICLDSIAPGLGADTTNESADNYGWFLKDKEATEHNMSDYVLERDFKGWVYSKFFEISNPALASAGTGLESYYKTSPLNGSTGELVFKHSYEYEKNIWNSWDDWNGKGNRWTRFNYTKDDGSQALNSDDGGGENNTVYFIIDPGSDIKIEFAFYDENGVSIDGTSQIFYKNSYFAELLNENFDKIVNNASSEQLKPFATAQITSGRHLQNLSFYTYSKLLSNAVLMDDIDFSKDGTGQSDCYEYWNSAETNKGTERAQNLYDFVPVDNKFTGESTAVSIYGNPESLNPVQIKYIRIDSTTYNDGKPETIDTFTDKNYKYTAFFTDVYNRDMKNLTFYCPYIKSNAGDDSYTGTILAKPESGCHLSDLTVINPIVEGAGYVGGVCGEWSSPDFRNAAVRVEEVEHYFDNYNYSYTNDNTDSSKLSGKNWGNPKDDPYSYFHISGTSENSYAGGIAGNYTTNRLDNSYSSVRVESKGYAGGLVGKADSVEVDRSYVSGHTYNGGFIGKTDTDGYDYVLVNVYGEKGAGGVVGKGSVKLMNGSYSTCSVATKDNNNAHLVAGEGTASSNDKNREYVLGRVINLNGKDYIDEYDEIIENIREITYDIKKLDEVKESYSTAKEKFSPLSTDQALTYDNMLEKLYGGIYPYPAVINSQHIGDWPEDPPIFGVFYWEQRNDNSDAIHYYGKYYNAKTDEVVTIGTEIEADSTESYNVTDFGYGYIYTDRQGSNIPHDMDSIGQDYDGNNISLKNIILEDLVLNNDKVDFIPEIVLRKMSANPSDDTNAHTRQTIQFNYNYLGNAGVKYFTYHPDFYTNIQVTDNPGEITLGARDKLQKVSETTPEFDADLYYYYVRNEEQFTNINYTYDGIFKQQRNIELYGDFNSNSFKPLCHNNGFIGIYDGHPSEGVETTITVNGILCSNINSYGNGIFAKTSYATLKNIKVVYNNNCLFSFSPSFIEAGHEIGVGGLVGVVVGGSIENCNIEYKDGSLLGFGSSSLIEAKDIGNKAGAGGLVGIAVGGSIKNCIVRGLKFDDSVSLQQAYASSKANINLSVGGIAGYSSADILNCTLESGSFKFRCNTGKVVVSFGGIAGSASGNILNCAATFNNAPESTSYGYEAEFHTPFLSSNLSPEQKREQQSIIFVGGIVGNNVSINGETELNVSSCTANAHLTRDIFNYEYLIQMKNEYEKYKEDKAKYEEEYEKWDAQKKAQEAANSGSQVMNDDPQPPVPPTPPTVDLVQLIVGSKDSESGKNFKGNNFNVLVHPIAPVELYVDVSKREYYGEYYEFLNYAFNESQVPDNDGQLPNNGKLPNDKVFGSYKLITGQGRDSSGNFNVHITNCTFNQGGNAYNSQIYGSESGTDGTLRGINSNTTATKISVTATPDIYLIAPNDIISVELSPNPPIVGIYSLYEKIEDANKSSVVAEIVENSIHKEGDTNNITINETITEPQDGYLPLYKYGILVERAKLDDTEVYVDGQKVELIPTYYTDKHGSNLEQTVSFDMTEALNLQPGTTHTVEIKYNKSIITSGGTNNDPTTQVTETVSLCTYTITVPERKPFGGVYELRKDTNGELYADGAYSGWGEDKVTLNSNETDPKTGDYGVMIEHSTYVAPQDPTKFSVEIYTKSSKEPDAPYNNKPLFTKQLAETTYKYNLAPQGVNTFKDISHQEIKVKGKCFDFYQITDADYDLIPQGSDFKIVLKYYTGNSASAENGYIELASGEFHKDIKVPYVGIYCGWKGPNNDNSYYSAFVVKNPNQDERIVVNSAQNAAQDDNMRFYGIMLEKGIDFDVKNIEVTVKTDYEDETAVLRGDQLIRDSKIYLYGGNTGPVSSYGSVNYDLYLIPEVRVNDGKIVEDGSNDGKHIFLRAKTISVKYICSEDVSTSLDDVKIVDDIKGVYKEHDMKTVYDYNSEEHWHECMDERCPENAEVPFVSETDEASDADKTSLTKVVHHREDIEKHTLTNKEFSVYPTPVNNDEGAEIGTKGGRIFYRCEICDYKNPNDNEEAKDLHEHTHKFDGGFKSDENSHWQECTDAECPYTLYGKQVDRKINEAEHTLVYEKIEGNADKHRVKCDICGWSAEEDHHWGDVEVSEDGRQLVYTCTGCGYKKTVDKPILENAKYVGVYVEYVHQVNEWSSEYKYVGYMNKSDGSGVETVGSEDLTDFTATGNIGILMLNEEYVRYSGTDITINGISVPKDQIKPYSPSWQIQSITSYYNYNPSLTTFSIPLELIGDAGTVTISITFENESLFTAEVKVK